MATETLRGVTGQDFTVGKHVGGRKRDEFGKFVKETFQRAKNRSHSDPPVLTGDEVANDKVVLSDSLSSFLQLDRLLEDSMMSMGAGNIGMNSRRDWIGGDFPRVNVLAELKKARIALRDIGTGKATVELFDGRNDDLGFLINALNIKGGKKEFPVEKKAMGERLAVIDREIQDLNSRGFSGRELEALSLERVNLAFQITLLGLPERDYVELEKIKGANTSIEGVLANVVRYKFAGVSHSRVTITLSDEMKGKAKDDLQNLPPLTVKG